MAEGLSAIVGWELSDALEGESQVSLESEGTAKVSRVDTDGTVWLRLVGRSEDTPVNGDILASCQSGDSVRWSIDGTRMSVTGNMSSPSVGMTHVDGAVAPVSEQAMHAGEIARTARELADSATTDALRAYIAAESAIHDADRAYNAAGLAEASAQSAMEDASTAHDMAESAIDSANKALINLSVVEDVAGTLQWIQDHCTFTLTQDTEIEDGKIYFVISNGDYVPVSEPVASSLSTYYELTNVDESQAEYVMAHLALTSAGLWVLPSGIDAATPQASSGYKALFASTGMKVYDPSGYEVASYGTTTVIGRTAQPHVEATSDGVTIYSSSSRKRANVGATGLKVYVGDTAGSETEVASFGEQTRIGESPTYQTVATYFESSGISIRTRENVSPFPIFKLAGIEVTDGKVTISTTLSMDEIWTYEIPYKPATGTDIELLSGLYSKTVFGTLVAGTSDTLVIGDATYTYDGDRTISHTVYDVAYESYFGIRMKVHSSPIQPTLHIGYISPDKPRGENTASVGAGLIASGNNQTVLGTCNVPDANSEHALIIGNGTADNARSNAFSVEWDGSTEIGPQALDSVGSGVTIHASNISPTDQTNSSTIWGNLVACYDSAGVLRGYFREVDKSNGQQGIQIETRRHINGTSVYNTLNLLVDASGNRVVEMAESAPWLSALGLTVSSGTLPLTDAVAYSTAQTPKYYKWGKVVTVTGAVKPKNEVAADGSMLIATLPSGYRPPQDVWAVCHGSSQYLWLLHIQSGGNMYMERYATPSDWAACGTSHWLPFTITYVVE